MAVPDRLTKLVHLIPHQKTASSADIAKLFIRHIVRHHGIPQSIVSDPDPKFVSNFWKSLSKLMNIQLKMSTSDHPETDGQSEPINRTFIEMLRSHVNERNTNWSEFVPLIEIVINNTKQSSSGISPYFINYGYHPNFNGIYEKSKAETNSSAAESFISRINQAVEFAKSNIIKSQSIQKQQADYSRRDHEFKVGDQVFIIAEHIKQLNSGVNKLQPRTRGPFKIIQAINKNVFKLELPPTWKVNNSFHVSKLKLAHLNDDDKFPLRKLE